MADTSPFTVEERLVAVVWYHERRNTNKTTKRVQEDFEERFGKPAPSKSNLHLWEKKAFQSGSVLDSKRSGRPKIRDLGIQNIQTSVLRYPKKSLRKRSAELGVSYSSLRRTMKEDLHMKPYKPTVICELSDADHENRLTACDRLQHFDTIPKRSKDTMIGQQVQVLGYQELMQEVQKRSKQTLFVYFSGSKGADGTSWCPDCVEAEPVVQAELQNLPAGSTFIYCQVGDRPYWKDGNNEFRKELKVTSIPTLLKYGTSQQLVEKQCCQPELVRMLLTEEV
uniref:Thioredoxin domain-containing protein 17 n=1 Tax=Eptatretus burgeri TaxID=7764 RepID=A0A8C4QXF2_EPTBU